MAKEEHLTRRQLQLKRETTFEDVAGAYAQQAVLESSAIGVPSNIEPWVVDFGIGVAAKTAIWADENPAWINVNDCLPEEGELTIIYTSNGSIAISKYEEGEWIITNLLHAINVTHWMKIPKPPRK